MKRYFWLEELNGEIFVLCYSHLEEVKKKEEDKNDDERGNRKVYDIIVKCIWLKSSDVC